MGCSPCGREEWDTTERLHSHFSLSCIGEGNGNPLQCSCLENPRDGGAWWAAVYGVAQSRTRVKRLSSSSSSFLKQGHYTKETILKTSQVELVVKNLPANIGDLRDVGSITGLERFPGGGHGNPLQYSCLENPMDRCGEGLRYSKTGAVLVINSYHQACLLLFCTISVKPLKSPLT